MSKVVGMLIALVAFCALPAVALAGGDTVSSGNTQSGEINQSAEGGDGGSGGGNGGDAGNQAAIVQQNAGRDANASVNQSQSFGGSSSVGGGGDNGDCCNGGGDDDDVSGDNDDNGDNDVSTSGVGGGNVESVTLARTGFDAWLLALFGGLSLAGGLSLLVLQRHGRTES
jgi:hypothetical protein